MPKLSLAAVAVIGAFASIDGALAQQVTSVTLYPGSATVERSAKITAGAGRLEMAGLPANFDLRTLRVEADPGIAIGEIAVQELARSEALGGREAALEAKIQALKDQSAAFDGEARTAELVRDYLASLSARPDDQRRAAVDPRSLPAVLEAIRRGGADAYGTLQRVAMKKREVAKSIAALERDLARLRSGARDVRILAIAYSAKQPGELRAA